MKNIIIFSIFLFSFLSVSAYEVNVSKADKLLLDTSIVITHEQIIPWSTFDIVNMQQVYKKKNYTLWKCPSYLVTNYPNEHIVGKRFNYFVYKNDDFHMSVTEMNKESVYKFFTDDKY